MLLAFVAILWFSPRRLTAAQLPYTGQHSDIGLAYENGDLHIHYHFGSTSIVNGVPVGGVGAEYEPEEIYAVVPNSVLRPISGGVATAFGSATQAYIFGQTGGWSGGPPISQWPYIGFAAEELGAGDWVNNEVFFQVMDVNYTGPATNARFGLLTTNSSLSSLVDSYALYNAATDTLSGVQPLLVGVGGHDHANWAFTAPGTYEVTMRGFGTHTTNGFEQSTGVFTFVVDPQAIPEPASTAAILVAAAIGCWQWKRHRRRNTTVA
jgi:surface-anchored protein